MFERYLVPHKHNDFHPHLFRLAGVAVFFATIAIGLGATVLQRTILTKTDYLAAVISSSIIDLTNVDRAAAGLPALHSSALLAKAAQEKADDMALKGYFAHTSPDGTTPWHWFSAVGYDFIYAGENLAINYDDSAMVVNAWMNSPAHRANILNPQYTEIGIASARGYYNGKETVFIAQLFGMPARAETAALGDSSFLNILAMPSAVMDDILIFLAAMIFISLILVAVIEAVQQRTRHMLYAVLMLVIVFILYFVCSPIIFSGTIAG